LSSTSPSQLNVPTQRPEALKLEIWILKARVRANYDQHKVKQSSPPPSCLGPPPPPPPPPPPKEKDDNSAALILFIIVIVFIGFVIVKSKSVIGFPQSIPRLTLSAYTGTTATPNPLDLPGAQPIQKLALIHLRHQSHPLFLIPALPNIWAAPTWLHRRWAWVDQRLDLLAFLPCQPVSLLPAHILLVLICTFFSLGGFPSQNMPSQASNDGPGFWTGLATGGVIGSLLSRGGQSSQPVQPTGFPSSSYPGPAQFNTNIHQTPLNTPGVTPPPAMHTTTSSPASQHHTATGFATTKKR